MNAERTKKQFCTRELTDDVYECAIVRRTDFYCDPFVHSGVAVAFISAVFAELIYMLCAPSFCTMHFWPWETFRNCNLKNLLCGRVVEFDTCRSCHYAYIFWQYIFRKVFVYVLANENWSGQVDVVGARRLWTKWFIYQFYVCCLAITW